MNVYCDRLKLGSTAALNCQTGQNKGRYCKKELSFLLTHLVDINHHCSASATAHQFLLH